MTYHHGLLKYFDFDEPVTKTKFLPFKTLSTFVEVTLACITLREMKSGDRLLFTGTVGSRTTFDDVILELKIRQGDPTNGRILFLTRDGFGVDTGEMAARTTSFTHAKKIKGHCKKERYFLTGTLVLPPNPEPNGQTIEVIGPVVFTGSVIERKHKK